MKKVVSDNNKVINLADRLQTKPGDSIEINSTNQSKYTAQDMESLSPEDRMQILKYQKQMEYYQIEQNKSQANAILTNLMQEINNSDNKNIIPDHLYDELYNYLIEYIMNFMNESMTKIYNEIKENLIGEFKRELTNPFTKKEYRIENRIQKYDPHFFDNNTDITIPISNILKDSFKQASNQEATDTLNIYRLLNFIINTSVDSILFKSQKYKDDILSIIGTNNDLLQSIAHQKITHKLKMNIIRSIPQNKFHEVKEAIIDILDFIFPETNN